MEETLQKLLDMQMLEQKSAKELGVGNYYHILRVPGGWVFIWRETSCFVPEPKVAMPVKATPKKRQAAKKTGAKK